MKIGIDIDDVLNDLSTPWLAAYNKASGDNLKCEEIKGWDITRYCLPDWKEKICDFLFEPGMFRNAPVQPHARESIPRLLMQGHEVYFISAFYPHTNGCVEKTAWLEEHFPMLDIEQSLIFCKAKEMVNVDVLIDDNPHNLKRLAANVIPVVFTKPWNTKEDMQYRADDWPAVLRIINSLGSR